MSNADARSELVFNRLLIGIVGLAITSVGIGLVIHSRGVAEPAKHGESAPITVNRQPTPMTEDQQAASNANGHFAIDLYRRLAEKKSGENLFLSPFSISTVLTMAAEGAVDQTLDQMLDVLHIPKGALEQIHHGQRGLQHAVVPDVPPELTRKIAALRSELTETNDRTTAFKKAEEYKEAYKSSVAGRKLAKEINALMSRVSAYELQISNALWLEQGYPIEPQFASVIEPNYGAVLFPVDFKGQPESARLRINQWVAQQTSDRIQDALSPGAITDQTRLVLTNTVYFRGEWALPFESSDTHPQPFRQTNDRSTEVAMMHQWNWKAASYGAFQSNGELFPSPREVPLNIKDDDPSLYPDAKGHTMLSLDYQGQKIQMIVLLPQSVTGITELEKFLTYDRLQQWIGQLEHRMVEVSIPKFKLASRYQLNDTLRSLGMVRSFEAPKDNLLGAQFDKLSSTGKTEDRLYISDVIHQTYVDVSEVGTEAAAATSIDEIGDDSDIRKTRPFTPIFNADRPFLFLIRDRDSASILFLGRYVGT
jgi:serpin B